ncbi:hypothetical protein [Phreatobacter sp.]|nr:hypothetical protein [Phreatobacter sp.]
MTTMLSDWTMLAAGLVMVLLLAENMLGVTGATLLAKDRVKRPE